MQKLNQTYINTIVRKALEEDLRPRGDITTNLITSKDKIIKAKIIAKQDGVIAGLDFCKTAFKLIGKESVFTKKISDGKSSRFGSLRQKNKCHSKVMHTISKLRSQRGQGPGLDRLDHTWMKPRFARGLSHASRGTEANKLQS